MSFGAPKPPDPQTTANTQQAYNTNAATTQNRTNSYNQSTPYGSLSYASDPNSPSGYSVNVNLTPEQQNLLDIQQGTQTTLGGAGKSLAADTAGMYSSNNPIDGSAVTNQLNQWRQQYLQPIFNQQDSNLEAQLRNQGLAPGSEAYNNAKNLLARNQGDVTNQYLTENQQQGYDQAVANYLRPLQVIQGLMGASAPSGPTFQQTPTAQIQPANYAGAVQNNYEQENAAYGQTMSGLFGIPTALAGGWARSGFPGVSALAGMFA